MARDNYLGYEIEFTADREDYRVLLADKIVYSTPSYDRACEWIELANEFNRRCAAR